LYGFDEGDHAAKDGLWPFFDVGIDLGIKQNGAVCID